jgi:membrane protein
MVPWPNVTQIRRFSVLIYEELLRTRVLTIAAAMAFYFFLALFPLLILFASLLGYLPGHDVFATLLRLVKVLVPSDAMDMVEKVVASVVTPHRGGLLSFGVAGYLWAVNGGFAATIEALDVANDVEVSRPWWRDRLQALLLTFVSGVPVSFALLTSTAGPAFGRLIGRLVLVPPALSVLWILMHFVVTVSMFVLGVELLYHFGPNTRRSFSSTFPGAVVAVAGWFGGSFCLNFYLSHFANYNKTYGSLGAVIALMLWFYLVALSILVGGEINAELWKARHTRRSDDPMNRAIPGIPAA